MAAVAATPQPPRRRPGRPRIHPLVDRDSEPPAKRRKHTPARYEEEVKAADTVKSSPVEEVVDHEEENTIQVESYTPIAQQTVTPAPQVNRHTSPKRSARTRTVTRPRRELDKSRTQDRAVASPRPRYSSAAAAAAASQANGDYKPREERSWEDFHPDLDIEAALVLYTADEVDGRTKPEPRLSLLRQDTSAADADDSQEIQAGDIADNGARQLKSEESQIVPAITPKRRPGRPPRKPESMLSGLGSPPAPRILPLPTHNPKERLNLPKPSYKRVQTFKTYEEDKKVRVDDYVDKAMAHVGYQESERFDVPQDILIRHCDGPPDDDMGAGLVLESDGKPADRAPPQVGNVEYDMDEQDEKWLESHNAHRREEQADPIKPSIFEITMTQLEREYYALEKSTSLLHRYARTDMLTIFRNTEAKSKASKRHKTSL